MTKSIKLKFVAGIRDWCITSSLFHIQTLEEAAKVPMRKKQPCGTSAENRSGSLRSQFSHHLYNFRADHNHCVVDVKLLESQLTCENYQRKFHQLLCREEEEHERLLAERLALSQYVSMWHIKFISLNG